MEQIILGAKDKQGNLFPWASQDIFFVRTGFLNKQLPLVKGKPYHAHYISLFPFEMIGEIMSDDYENTIYNHPELTPVYLVVDVDLSEEEKHAAGNGSIENNVLKEKDITFVRETKEPLIDFYRNRVGIQLLNKQKIDNFNTKLSYWDFIRRDYSNNEFEKVYFPILMSYNNKNEKYPYDLDITDVNLERIFYLITKTAMDYHNYTFGVYGVSRVSEEGITKFINKHKQTLTSSDVVTLVDADIFNYRLDEFLSKMPVNNLIKNDLSDKLRYLITINALRLIDENGFSSYSSIKKDSLYSLADFKQYFYNQKFSFLHEDKEDVQETLKIALDNTYLPYSKLEDYSDAWYDDEEDGYDNLWVAEYDEQMDVLEGILGFYPTILTEVFDDKYVREFLKDIACENLIERVLSYNE